MGKMSALSQSSCTKSDGAAPVEVGAGFGLESVKWGHYQNTRLHSLVLWNKSC